MGKARCCDSFPDRRVFRFNTRCGFNFINLRDGIKISAGAVLTAIAGVLFIRMMICAVSRVMINGSRNMCV